MVAAASVTAIAPKRNFWPPQVKTTAALHFLLVAIYFAAAQLFFAESDGLLIEGDVLGGDFMNLWAAAHLVLDGRIMMLFDLGGYAQYQDQLLGHAINFHNWSYPLHLLPWIVGLGLLPYAVALAAWLCITFALYAFAVAYKRPGAWVLTGVLLIAPASFENIIDGQNGFLSAACMVAGLRLLDKRPVLAGIAFGFLTFKPQLGLLVPVLLLAGRHWKTIVAAVTTVAVLVGISIGLFGIEPWLAYFRIVVPFQTSLLEISVDKSFASMVPTPFMAMRHFGASLSTAYSVALLFTAAMIGIVAWVFIQPVDADRRAGIVLTAMFLATPYGVNYDMTSLSAAIICVLAAQNGRPLGMGTTALLIAAWVLPLPLFLLNAHGYPVGPFVLTAFLLWQVRQIRQSLNLRRAP